MPHWNKAIKLADLVALWNAGELLIPELATKVADRLEQSGWIAEAAYPDTLKDRINRLRQVTTQDQYTNAFDYIYDSADDDRVWIETH